MEGPCCIRTMAAIILESSQNYWSVWYNSSQDTTDEITPLWRKWCQWDIFMHSWVCLKEQMVIDGKQFYISASFFTKKLNVQCQCYTEGHMWWFQINKTTSASVEQQRSREFAYAPLTYKDQKKDGLQLRGLWLLETSNCRHKTDTDEPLKCVPSEF